jgi:CheY-like chemotaxis protein
MERNSSLSVVCCAALHASDRPNSVGASSPDPAPAGDHASQPQARPAERPGQVATVLVVDDEPAIRRLVCFVLQRNGYQVLEAADGEAALDLCRQERPIDLLVTDVVMHPLDGRRLAQQVAEIRPQIKILFMSGYTGEWTAPEETFLVKPFSPDTLTRRVREILERP